MALVLYSILASVPCMLVRLTAKALGVDLKLKNVNIKEGENKTESYLQMNPAHCVPTLNDGGFTVWESRVIATYLSDKYGQDDELYPKDVQQRSAVDTMLHFDTGLYHSLASYIYPQVYARKEKDIDRLKVVIDKLDILETIFKRQPYATGENVTLADFSIACTLTLTQVFDSVKVDLSPYPNVTAWRTRFRSQLSYYDEVTAECIETLRSSQDKQWKK